MEQLPYHPELSQPAPGLTIDTESEAAVLPWVAELFGPFDTNNDGVLDLAELGPVLESLGVPTDRAPAAMAACGQGGVIAATQFRGLLEHLGVYETLEAVAATPRPAAPSAAFQRFDTDGDGRLSEAEVHAMLASLGFEVDEAYVQEVLSIFGDTDAHGAFIEPGEFERLAEHLGLDAAMLTGADAGAAAEPGVAGSDLFRRFDADGEEGGGSSRTPGSSWSSR